MQFRAVIYAIDRSVAVVYDDGRANWFFHRGRAYRKDRDAVCQVVEPDKTIRGTVEAIYIEGNPVALRSSMTPQNITLEHVHEKLAESQNRPQKSFWDM